MNNFSKVYTLEDIKNFSLTTVYTLPMEESIMVPVAQTVELMKKGENIAYFTFNHDSIKVSKFFQKALEGEEGVERFGKLAVIDQFQIPEGMSWDEYIRDMIKQIRLDCELNIIILDVMDYVRANDDEENLYLKSMRASIKVRDIAYEENISIICINTVQKPMWTAIQKPKKEDLEITTKDVTQSVGFVTNSDFVFSINRVDGTSEGLLKKILKKIINFLWFWRKKNNFTLNVLKNRRGPDTKSYRMNIDLDKFKTEVL